MTAETFSADQLEGFRHTQRLAYACAQAVEKELRVGMTEKQAAALMAEWLADHGVQHYLHKPFAWFGERTAFQGFWNPSQFFPTGKALTEGMPVILDVAPIVDGYTADIGYSCVLGENRVLAQMQKDLLLYRDLIVEKIREGQTLRQVYNAVDDLSVKLGYTNEHKKYPQRVLAHRVTHLEPNRLARPTLAGFGVQQVLWLSSNLARAFVNPAFEGPVWNGDRLSDYRPTPGLWAVEPHLGFHGVGAKWEEILVITEDSARWLDDDVPHVTRFDAPGPRRKSRSKRAA